MGSCSCSSDAQYLESLRRRDSGGAVSARDKHNGAWSDIPLGSTETSCTQSRARLEAKIK